MRILWRKETMQKGEEEFNAGIRRRGVWGVLKN